MSTKSEVLADATLQKFPDEEIIVAFDFTNELGGSTISSISGNDANGNPLGVDIEGTDDGVLTIGTAAINSGGATSIVEGNTTYTIATSKGVTVNIYGGTVQTTYYVRCSVRSADSQTWTKLVQVQVCSRTGQL